MYNKLEVMRTMMEAAAKAVKQYQQETDADFSVLVSVTGSCIVFCAPGKFNEEQVRQTLNAIMETIN